MNSQFRYLDLRYKCHRWPFLHNLNLRLLIRFRGDYIIRLHKRQEFGWGCMTEIGLEVAAIAPNGLLISQSLDTDALSC